MSKEDKKDADKAPKAPMKTEKKVVEPAKKKLGKGKVMCRLDIKENGTIYKAGAEYTGGNKELVKRCLKRKSMYMTGKADLDDTEEDTKE